MKAFAALLMSLLLMMTCAQAEGTIAAYSTPEGAQMVYLDKDARFIVPDGLEPLYELMTTASPRSDVYLMRMEHGRALGSISCTMVTSPLTAGELYERWETIAQGISKEAKLSDASANVTSRFGFEVLHMSGTLEKEGLVLSAEAVAFCRGLEMMEVWAVCPAASVYEKESAEAEELAQDRADLRVFLGSLDFSGKTPQSISGVPYEDEDGRFALELPSDAVVLTQRSPMEEVSAARERFVEANKPGADHLFDEIYMDVLQENVVLILTGDMKGAVQVFASQNENFAGATPTMLSSLANPINGQLKDRFGASMCLAEDERVMLSGREHALLGYWIRSDECNAQLDIAACVMGEDWLCEVDIFTIDGDVATRALLHTMLGQTLTYQVP